MKGNEVAKIGEECRAWTTGSAGLRKVDPNQRHDGWALKSWPSLAG